MGWAGQGPRASPGQVRRAQQRGGARERRRCGRREERGGGDREARARPPCGLAAEAAQKAAGATSGRAGSYRAAAAGRRGASTPAWPPEPGVPRPRRPSPPMPPRAARPALQVARLRMRVTDRKFPRTGAKWKGGGSLSPPAGAEAGEQRLGRASGCLAQRCGRAHVPAVSAAPGSPRLWRRGLGVVSPGQ